MVECVRLEGRAARGVAAEENAAIGGPSYRKSDGTERTLENVLRDIAKHLAKGSTDKDMTKALHGAMAELGKKEGVLSVTSMNQLVHNTVFSVTTSDVCTVFSNVFPLLKAMNQWPGVVRRQVLTQYRSVA